MSDLFVPNPAFVEEIVHGEALQSEIADIAAEGLAIAQDLVLVDSGELSDSLHVEDSEDGTGKRVVAGTDHWAFPEFGTATMPPEPYLRPIVDALGLHR